jgi:SAM-dependent methyltransferase
MKNLVRSVAARFKARNKTPRQPTSTESYLEMQRTFYQQSASQDLISPGNIEGDHVVGSWALHNSWPDYADYLMNEVPKTANWEAIEYGCGPGRNILRWSDLFARIDGVDISEQNLKNAKDFLGNALPPEKFPRLYLTTGDNCGAASSSAYDFAFSTICLQHICVHSVRLSILKDLFRCLRKGGIISVQMGYGVPSPMTVGYFDDHYSAEGTNRACDVAIESPGQIESDLLQIGFKDFRFHIRPVGPGDLHPNWIFFSATK